MISTVSKGQFIDAFRDYGREDNFSYSGLCALYDYLTELEEDIGQPIELDVIGICCDFTEYDSFESFQNDYGDSYDDLDAVRYETTVIEFGDSDGFIIQQF